MDFFDMECHLHCAIPRMQCPKCGKVMPADVPWAQENSGFTLLFEAKGVELMKEIPVNATGRYLGVTDKRLWRVLDKYVEGGGWNTRTCHTWTDSMWMRHHVGEVTGM